MSYELTDYQGNKLILPNEKAIKIAGIAELIEVEIAGQTHFINPRNIAGIRPTVSFQDNNLKIEAPNYRGKDSPSKEKIREMLLKKKKLVDKL